MTYLKISKREAYYLGITLWSYLYQFPEIEKKAQLPKVLWLAIKGLFYWCPCCSVYYNKKTKACCGCPLWGHCSTEKGSNYWFKQWEQAKTTKVRKAYAKKILDKIIEGGY
jgi:hypothetical protein